jgi:hypothetical protein
MTPLKTVLKFIFLIGFRGCAWLLPLISSLAIQDLHPNKDPHWLLTGVISLVLAVITVWLISDSVRDQRAYDRAKNEAQSLNIGGRIQWDCDSGTIIEKGLHHVIVRWDKGGEYPDRLNRVWPKEK